MTLGICSKGKKKGLYYKWLFLGDSQSSLINSSQCSFLKKPSTRPAFLAVGLYFLSVEFNYCANVPLGRKLGQLFSLPYNVGSPHSCAGRLFRKRDISLIQSFWITRELEDLWVKRALPVSPSLSSHLRMKSSLEQMVGKGLLGPASP